jgi:uncharacterized protein (UPF0332 family)
MNQKNKQEFIVYRIKKALDSFEDAKLFDLRLKSDYGDMFDFDNDLVESLFPQVEEFLQIIKNKFDY